MAEKKIAPTGQEVFLKHPVFEREEVLVLTRKSMVDSAGYRSVGDLVRQFSQAGVQLQAFRAAEYSGDLTLSPIHQVYIDPVDRDRALQEAIERGKKARKDYEAARKAALDKRELALQAEIERVAERLRRVRDAQVPKEVPREESQTE